MSGKIYALLCGVNDYLPDVGRLYGCLNDVDHYADFLRSNFDASRLELEILKDADATRPNIIAGFRNFLSRAKSGDVALFQYAGHGARRKSAQQFLSVYPDGQDEGLVCYDSRRGSGNFDLADKELAVLIDELAPNRSHVAVILDCCHSGSGTRSADDMMFLSPRMTHYIAEERPLDSYLDGHFSKLDRGGGSMETPVGPHILLAACERGQKAFEADDQRGIFSTTMLGVLDQNGVDVDYADLFVRVRASVRKNAFGQNPQFEVFGGFNGVAGFLGTPVAKRRQRFTVTYGQGKWRADCGALHGLPCEVDQPVQMAIYRDVKETEPIGRATATGVGLASCSLAIGGFEPEKKVVYKAELTSLPAPPLLVVLTGVADGQKLVEEFHSGHQEFGSFCFVCPETKGVDYVLVATGDGFELRHNSTPSPNGVAAGGKLIQGVRGKSEAALKAVFLLLKQVAMWGHGVALQNKSAKASMSAVDFCFCAMDAGGKEVTHEGTSVELPIVREGNGWSQISGKLKARNNSDQTLHLMLVYYSENFGRMVHHNEPVPPKSDWFYIPFTIHGKGKTNLDLSLDEDEGPEATHRLMLVVSAEQIDANQLDIEGLKIGETIDPAGTTRGVSFGGETDQDKIDQIDWFTKRIDLRLVRQIAELGKSDCKLAGGKIAVLGHPALKGSVGLAEVRTGGRSVGRDDSFCHVLAGQGLQLVNFGTAGESDTNVLELQLSSGRDSLKENPLEMLMDVGLGDNEFLLPIVFDGQHPMLAGQAWQDDSGRSRVQVNRIPEEVGGARSVGSAVRMYFFKTVLKMENVDSISSYSFGESGTVHRSRSSIGDRVAGANRILLLIHGMFGDSYRMASDLAGAKHQDGSVALSGYDLVLGYDYERLNSTMQDTSKQLQEQLKLIGIAEGGKHVSILAHSTGGLVARWLIEQDGGKEFVDHLVMFGTPNGGSPLGKIGLARNAVGVLTSMAIAACPAFAPFGAGLLAMMLKSKSLSVAMEQLDSGSSFLRTLNASDDPSVKYSIVAGNIDELQVDSNSSMNALFRKLCQQWFAGMVFDKTMHDAAVSADSASSVGQRRDPKPVTTVIPCHHFGYFNTMEGRNAISSMKLL